MGKMKTKYKKGDVLQTLMGRIFVIEGIEQHVYAEKWKYFYALSGHPRELLDVEYLDNSQHVRIATPAGKVLFGR
jgi:hypothetical protein